MCDNYNTDRIMSRDEYDLYIEYDRYAGYDENWFSAEGDLDDFIFFDENAF